MFNWLRRSMFKGFAVQCSKASRSKFKSFAVQSSKALLFKVQKLRWSKVQGSKA